jgi:endonuclease YncB( thermonuclease family)
VLPESGELQTWGTVRLVLNATNLIVVSPELARLRVRLLGLEPPEPPRSGREGNLLTEGQPFGPQAIIYARDLLLDKQVRLETHGTDQSGRIMAVVWLGDINVNLTLIKEGFAWVSPDVSVPKVRIELEVAERQAQVGKYGLWALPDPEPPWEFRRRHRLARE